MVLNLKKIIVIVLVTVELVAGTPLRQQDYENFSPHIPAPSLFRPFLAPVTKVQQYGKSFGNLFAPAVAYPINKDEIPSNSKEPFNYNSGKKPVIEVLTPSPKSSERNDNYEKTTSKSIKEPVAIDKEILDKIFNNYKEIDQNYISTTEDTTIEYTTGTGDYETTTDYFLRIPAPVIATLLGG